MLDKLLRFAFLRLIRDQLAHPLPLSTRSAVIFSPHPDDETLGCGGMIALKCQQGASVHIVFMTDGAASHPRHPKITPQQLSQIRQQEAITAVTILGVSRDAIHFLNLPDGGLATLSSTMVQSTLMDLEKLLLKLQPQEVYLPFYQDLLPDHEVTYQLVSQAVAATQLNVDWLQYPIWLLFKPWNVRVPLSIWQHIYYLNISSVWEQKQKAMQMYRSQCLAIPPDRHPALGSNFLQLFNRPYELFFKLPSSF